MGGLYINMLRLIERDYEIMKYFVLRYCILGRVYKKLSFNVVYVEKKDWNIVKIMVIEEIKFYVYICNIKKI